jgi:hypothetical protein
MRRSRSVRGLAVVLAVLWLTVLAGQPVQASPAHFGANLTGNIFVNNAYPGSTCDHLLTGGSGTAKCTWIEANAFNTGGSGVPGAQAPKDGYVNKIKLIAGKGGSFTLQIAHFNQSTHKGQVVTTGPKITYATDPCPSNCSVQTFNISQIKVHKGDYLAIRTSKASLLDCFSGSLHTALFKPPLVAGNPQVTETGDDGCYMLLQAVYKV